MMADQKFDPLKTWKDAYEQTERLWGKSMNETIKSEEYSAWMGSVLDVNLFYQKVMNDMTKGYLEKVNLPTQDDIARVATLVVNLENKVDNMEELLEEKIEVFEQSSSTKRDLTKLKSDIRSLEAKLDKVVELLASKQESHVPETK